MKKLILTVLLSWLSVSSAGAANIGIATEVEGDVRLLRGDTYYQVAVGVELQDADAVITGEDGKLQIDMIDGSNLLLNSSTRIRLAEYSVDENNNVISAAVDVVSGWLRFAVARLNENSTYSIDTPTMTIGIRGTEGVVEAGDEKAGIYMDEGEVNLYRVDAGIATAVPLAVAAGQYVEHSNGKELRRRLMTQRLLERRIPVRLTTRLARRVNLLKRHGVTPRMIRAARRHEIRQFLLRHPEARKKLRRLLREAVEERKELRRKRLDRLKQKYRQRQRNR